MIHLNKVKRDIINYGAVKVYETFLTITQDEVDPELFAAKQLKEIFEQKYDVIKVNIDFVVDEENEVVESEKMLFRLSSVSETKIAYMSNVDDNGSVSSLVLSKDGESVTEEVTEYPAGMSLEEINEAIASGDIVVPAGGTKLYNHRFKNMPNYVLDIISNDSILDSASKVFAFKTFIAGPTDLPSDATILRMSIITITGAGVELSILKNNSGAVETVSFTIPASLTDEVTEL